MFTWCVITTKVPGPRQPRSSERAAAVFAGSRRDMLRSPPLNLDAESRAGVTAHFLALMYP